MGTPGLNDTRTVANTPAPKRPRSRRRRVIREIVEWSAVVVVLCGLLLGIHVTHASISMVRTGSMVPALYPGDIVIATPGTPEAGDVVVFTPKVPGSELPDFVHRLTRIKSDGSWETKGDANEFADSAFVATSDIHGIVRFTLPTRFLTSSWLPFLGGALLFGMLAWWLLRRFVLTDDSSADPPAAEDPDITISADDLEAYTDGVKEAS